MEDAALKSLLKVVRSYMGQGNFTAEDLEAYRVALKTADKAAKGDGRVHTLLDKFREHIFYQSTVYREDIEEMKKAIDIAEKQLKKKEIV